MPVWGSGFSLAQSGVEALPENTKDLQLGSTSSTADDNSRTLYAWRKTSDNVEKAIPGLVAMLSV